MKISIVTISYNQVQFLRECIESVLSQKDIDLEYIVVDPGSTDGSRELIDSYGDRLIRIYENDKGPADGLNKGFAIATGKIYGYLNSDDMLLPNALSKINSIFSAESEVDVVYGHGYVIAEDGVIVRKCYSDRFSLVAAAYGAAIVIQPSTFFRKTAFQKVGGFNVDNRSNWDGELFIDLARAGCRLSRLDVFLSKYRIHSAGITGSGRLEELHKKHGRNMFEKIMGRAPRYPDAWIAQVYRFKKHLSHPRSTIERIVRGPIFASKDLLC